MFQDISKVGRMHLTALKTERTNSQLTSRAITDQQLNDEKLDPLDDQYMAMLKHTP